MDSEGWGACCSRVSVGLIGKMECHALVGALVGVAGVTAPFFFGAGLVLLSSVPALRPGQGSVKVDGFVLFVIWP